MLLLRGQTKLKSTCRNFSDWTSQNVRQTFLDFFSGAHHEIVPSSSVIPAKWRNKTPLPFVNAGMVQWRPIIMNETKLPRRFESGVANAQKCIRVGGKACDLEEVGHDGHHLSFFEMLGNWSFNGSYNRETAIKLAWDLLTNEYKIPKERLFVTYFNGCNKLGLPADEETKELWLANGVESQRILPFGADHNFWQMGLDGPCGPCTEIHFAHRDGIDLKNQVNKSDEVVELWNLVFMENCLDSSGKLSKLPSQHIDTGMGLERLTAVLRGSKSNYDTDLFSPLFDAISQRTKFEPYSGSFNRDQDTSYRILADHIRMCTICLSDGLYPDASPKMRQVLRRALRVLRDKFHLDTHTDLIETTLHLSQIVLETLHYHCSDPDLNLINSVLDFEVGHMLDQEQQNQASLAKLVALKGPEFARLIDPSDAINVLDAMKMIERNQSQIVDNNLSGELGYKIMDSTGLSLSSVKNICTAMDLSFNEESCLEEMEKHKRHSKLSSIITSNKLVSENLEKTDDSFKYQYKKMASNDKKTGKNETRYLFPIVQANVLQVLPYENDLMAVLLDKTCCYGEAGGQVGDAGILNSIDGTKVMTITDTKISEDRRHVWHIGNIHGDLKPGRSRVKVNFNVKKRIDVMQNHTGVHMLNAVLHQMFPYASQKSSYVDANGFKFDFTSLKSEFNGEVAMEVEQRVAEYIKQEVAIERENIQNPEASFEKETLKQVLQEKFPRKRIITMLDETYPSQVSIIGLPDAVEPCCGTHVENTADVQDFVITSVKATHPGQKSLRCVTGSRALKVRQDGIDFVDTAINLSETIESELTEENLKYLQKIVNTMQNSLNQETLPVYVKEELRPMLKEMSQHLASFSKKNHFSELLDSKEQLVIGILEKQTNLKTIEKKLDGKVHFILTPGKKRGTVIAVCNVPQSFANSEFNSQSWMSEVIHDGVKMMPFKGSSAYLTAPFPTKDTETLLTNAYLFAQNNLE